MLYRHYKGGLYRVIIDPAFHSETQEEMVVYMSVETGIVWIRPLGMFHGIVEHDGIYKPRFTEVNENIDGA